MTNKLIVITNMCLKVPKIKKILLYEMKVLVPNYNCLQNPSLAGYGPQIPVVPVLCPQLNFLNPPPSKIPGYATDLHKTYTFSTTSKSENITMAQHFYGLAWTTHLRPQEDPNINQTYLSLCEQHERIQRLNTYPCTRHPNCTLCHWLGGRYFP